MSKAQKSKAHLAALATTLALTAPAPLWADITPDEVWQSWQDSLSITATDQTSQGDTLILSGVTIPIPGDDNGPTVARLQSLHFRDNGDGTVAVLLPDRFPVTITPPVDPITLQSTEFTLNFATPGAQITAIGSPGSISYAIDLPKVDLSATLPEGPTETTALTARMTGATGTYLVQAAEVGTNMTHDYRVKTLDLTLDAQNLGTNPGRLTLSLTDLAGGLEMTGIPADSGLDLQTALNQGMTLDAKARYGIGSFDFGMTEQGNPLKVNGTLGGGDLVTSMTAALFRFQTNSKALSLNAAATDTASGQPFTLSATFASSTTNAEINGANWMDEPEFDASLQNGLTVSASAALGPAMIDFARGQTGPKTILKTSIGSLNTGLAMQADRLTYDLGAKALTLSATDPDMGVSDASMDLTELALSFAVPLAISDTPAPFTLIFKLVDLEVVDALWARLDPTGQLPRDPATLILDTKGTATLTRDLVDETVTDGTPPGLLNSLDLTQLLLRAAGAEVTGKGSMTFDNSDTTTFSGMPLPTGKLDLRALGLNALTDKLVAMGLLSDDDAMQGRMLLSMFANTDPAADEITSTLEFKDKGFFANGARLQ